MISATERRLLDDLSDDWYALWEVDQLLSRLAPEMDGSARRQLVRGLLEKQALALTGAEEWASLRDTPAIPTVDAIDAISSTAAWEVPGPHDRIYAVTAR